MRIVLDTNILARVLTGPAGPAAELLRRIAPPHLLIVSPFLLSELARVLGYARLRRIHAFDDDGIAAYVAGIESMALLIDPPGGLAVPPIPGDPQDDAILALAVTGHAEVLCTLDRHFHHPNVIAFAVENGLEIMGDVELLRRLGKDHENRNPAIELS